jgi:DNA-binding transcriptional MerR regulator
MKMQKRKFRIGELAQLLNVERFVIRFWEKEFIIKANRSEGGQRFYDEKDYEKFKQIKELLYERGFTIAGARKQLKVKAPATATIVVASQKTTLDVELSSAEKASIQERILTLQTQLLKLRELL